MYGVLKGVVLSGVKGYVRLCMVVEVRRQEGVWWKGVAAMLCGGWKDICVW